MQKKIAMIEENENFFDEIFELFVVSKTANGVSDATLRNYHYHRKAISKYLDTNRPISEITKRDLERMIVDMNFIHLMDFVKVGFELFQDSITADELCSSAKAQKPTEELVAHRELCRDLVLLKKKHQICFLCFF